MSLARAPGSSEQDSLGTLVTRLANDLTRLVRAETALVQVRITALARVVQTSGVRLAASAVVGLAGVGGLVAGLVLLLATRMPAWSAALLVGGVLLGLAAVIVAVEARALADGVSDALVSADEAGAKGGPDAG